VAGHLLSKATDNALVSRAMATYFRPTNVRQQLVSSSRLHWLGAKRYVVLSNVNETLAVYSVRGGGILRRLHRWPKELDQ